MAEIKNTFLQAKMNKDLDDRIIPNGQYRDALNIQIGKSEQDDIGAAQSARGNSLVIASQEDSSMQCIGMFMDNNNNKIYRFLTNYTDPVPAQINLPEYANPVPIDGYAMKIISYDTISNTSVTLVEGLFLNFATNKECQITGVNLIEDLLFWTDNRNQPRKINVNLANPTKVANPTYYTNETQISVAKYAPVEPISLIRKAQATVDTLTSPNQLELDTVTGITVGMTVIGEHIDISDYALVTDITGNVVTLYQAYPGTVAVGDVLTFATSTMSDQADVPSWPGDPDFLEDKFVRFSYRIKYDDNEYSIMAPFTQIAYIPKQKGFFINKDESNAFQSTVVRWMENNINNIELLIPLPDTGDRIANSYKIQEIEILYKESDSLAVQVIDTIEVGEISNSAVDTNIYSYKYQSQKPHKTLPESQTTRVYDTVPTRALAQESSGNRIMYGNYRSNYTPPSSINYNTAVSNKSKVYDSFIEYPNHTLKQNRNYQVGFILSDKFGRQSSVILSTVDIAQTGSLIPAQFGGSTVYAPYISSINDVTPRDWPGSALFTIINSQISSIRDIQNGTPGLYAIPDNSPNSGFSIIYSSIVGNSYIFYLNTTAGYKNAVPGIGAYLRGRYTDYVRILSSEDNGPSGWEIITDGPVSDIYEFDPTIIAPIPDTKFGYLINPIGWYSYKVVVRQQEHDYYNAYLPGMLNAYPLQQTTGSQVTYSGVTPTLNNGINIADFPTNEVNRTAHVVLINDNINKIPRDLSEVGPDQKQYRSSVELYGRVENTYSLSDPFVAAANGSNTNIIEYDPTAYPGLFAEIEVGDAIYSNANSSSSAPWYWNTFVTKIEIGSPNNKIYISTKNSFNTSDALYIVKGDNKQYYPTRKADTVSSIANATDFNFLQNSVDNIQGTAGLNLYQLQTNSLIGRISTSAAIGEEGTYMVPYLGVYETKPVQSLLDVFWETSTTGLISDLNYDVITGFDGPIEINEFDSKLIESQSKTDPHTLYGPTGVAGSSWITDNIYPLNQSGIKVMTTSASIDSVFIAGSNNSVAGSFGIIESPAGSGDYRIYIKDDFQFLHDSLTINKYTFNVSFVYNNISYPYPFEISLENEEPSFLTPGGYDMEVSSTNVGTVIETIKAENGSSLGLPNGLWWEIISGNSGGYFSINQTTGELSLLSLPPVDVYTITVQITDAVSFANPLSPQELTTQGSIPFSSRSATEIIVIKSIPAELNSNIRGYNSGPLVWQNAEPVGTVTATKNDLQPVSRLAHPYGYGLVYVGAQANATTPVVTISSGVGAYRYTRMPDVPTADRQFQTVHNVAVENGYAPTTLSQGTMRWTVNLHGHRMPATTPLGVIQPWQFQAAHASFLLYWRPTGSTNPADWELADSLNIGDQPSTDNNYNFTNVDYNTAAGGTVPYTYIGYPGGNVWQQQSMAGRVWNVAKSTANSMQQGTRTGYNWGAFSTPISNNITVTYANSTITYSGALDMSTYVTTTNEVLNYRGAPDVYCAPYQRFVMERVSPLPIPGFPLPNAYGVTAIWGTGILDYGPNTGNPVLYRCAMSLNDTAINPPTGDSSINAFSGKNLVLSRTQPWVTSSDGGLSIWMYPSIGTYSTNVNATIKRSTSFTTSVPGEYCLAVRMIDTSNVAFRKTIAGEDIGPYVTVEIDDANYTYDGSGNRNPDTAYEYYFRMNDTGGDASGVPLETQDAKIWDFKRTGISRTVVAAATVITLTDASWQALTPIILTPGMEISGYGITGGTLITSVDYSNRKITVSLPVTLALNGAFDIEPAAASPTSVDVFSPTNSGTEVKFFYTDALMTQKWIPPIANKFYTFRNKNRSYQSGSADDNDHQPDVTTQPNFCARFNASGLVSTFWDVPGLSINPYTMYDGPQELTEGQKTDIYYVKDTEMTKKLPHLAPLIMTAWTNNKSKTWTDTSFNTREFVNNYHENISQVIS
jgi:hypothetical protein